MPLEETGLAGDAGMASSLLNLNSEHAHEQERRRKQLEQFLAEKQVMKRTVPMDLVRQAIAAVRTLIAEIEERPRQESALRAEIERTEKAIDPFNADAVAKLQAKQGQLALMEMHGPRVLAELQQQARQACINYWRNAAAFHLSFEQLAQEAVEGLMELTARALMQHVPDIEMARQSVAWLLEEVEAPEGVILPEADNKRSVERAAKWERWIEKAKRPELQAMVEGWGEEPESQVEVQQPSEEEFAQMETFLLAARECADDMSFIQHDLSLVTYYR